MKFIYKNIQGSLKPLGQVYWPNENQCGNQST